MRKIAEYIFNIDQVLYDDDTKSLVAKPEYVGELIRCRDCKHWMELLPKCNKTGKFGYGVDDYCSKAERRDDG